MSPRIETLKSLWDTSSSLWTHSHWKPFFYALPKYIVFQFVSIASYLLTGYLWEEFNFILSPSPPFWLWNYLSKASLGLTILVLCLSSICQMLQSLNRPHVLYWNIQQHMPVYRGVQEWSGKRERDTSLHPLEINWLIQSRTCHTFFVTRSQSEPMAHLPTRILRAPSSFLESWFPAGCSPSRVAEWGWLFLCSGSGQNRVVFCSS